MIKNTLVCSFRNYNKFKKFDLNLLYKKVAGRRKYGTLTLVYDFYCSDKYSYLLDSKGIMHTLVTKDEK